jgi:DNA adenine methylase
MSETINSPFRYPGGKFYARKLILENIPAHNAYIEPFAGGASIFFAKFKVPFNQLNDVDIDLINVYQAIRDHAEELIYRLTKRPENESRIPEYLVSDIAYGEPLPARKELHSFFKNEFIPLDSIERAFRWYYLNRTSYSGIMNSQNMYWGYGDKFSMQPKNWPENIRRTSKKLQNVHLTSFDFEHVIDNAPDKSLLFVDPPYFNADQDKFYQHFFSKEDHIRLEECLRRNSERLHLFITYDNIKEIRELYNWVLEMHDKEWNYCIQRTDDQKDLSDKKGERYKGKELFLLNYSTEFFLKDSSSHNQFLLEM